MTTKHRTLTHTDFIDLVMTKTEKMHTEEFEVQHWEPRDWAEFRQASIGLRNTLEAMPHDAFHLLYDALMLGYSHACECGCRVDIDGHTGDMRFYDKAGILIPENAEQSEGR